MQTMNETPNVPGPATDRAEPPSDSLTPYQWARRNLFDTPANIVITVVMSAALIVILFKSLRFVFITGQWEPVRENMQLFMIALYPREHVDRIWIQVLLMAVALGLAFGLLRSTAMTVAEETNEPYVKTKPSELLGSFWPLILLVIVLLVLGGTMKPLLIVALALVFGAAGWAGGSMLKGDVRAASWTAVGILIAASFQVLSGTGGWAWGFTSLALVPLLSVLIQRVPASACHPIAALGAVVGVASLFVKPGVWTFVIAGMAINGLWQAIRGDARDGAKTGLLILAGLGVYLIMQAIGHEGSDWKEWGGFHLNAVVTVGATALAFPLGIMLAMGRRSALPVIKWLSIIYIEFFRGAPLITFLLAAQFFLGFFLKTDTPLSLTTRVMAAITLFSAAYIAEIIRGGLAAVPKGQIEAGQAMGMSQAKIMRLIVLPQALRAVIPAMVGQFISLFKDTSLLTIVALPELLGVRSLVHGQDAFRTLGIAETLTFVAFGFWAIAFSMSRESQRLERRLGVGVR